MSNVVTYLGPEASFTHQAALKLFHDGLIDTRGLGRVTADLQACTSITSIFNSLQQLQSSYGIVPLENSTNGPVAETCNCLANAKINFSQITIAGEVRVPVRHALLGPRSREVKPDSPEDPDNAQKIVSQSLPPVFGQDDLPDLTWIERLHTHPQAWGQCTKFLAHLSSLHSTTTTSTTSSHQPPQPTITTTDAPLPHPKRIDAKSTSSAASYIASLTPTTSAPTITDAAISSPAAASLHGLPILVSGIQDDHTGAGNVTRFLVLTNLFHLSNILAGKSAVPVPALLSPFGRASARKALLSFTLGSGPAVQPGALSAALGVFGRRGLNLTSVNPRPSGRRAWDYVWVVEVDLGLWEGKEGVREQAEARLADAVDELMGEAGARGDVLGVWWFDEGEDRRRD